MINWKVRFNNKLLVVALVSQLFILAEVLLIGAHATGLTDFQLTEEMEGWLLAVVNAIFGALSILGIVQDPTVERITDSARALNRHKPLTEEKNRNYIKLPFWLVYLVRSTSHLLNLE